MFIAFLDSSALLRLVLHESGHLELRAFVDEAHPCFSNLVCVTEALGVLKRKLFRGQPSRERYLELSYILTAFVHEGRIQLDNIELSDRGILREMEDLSKCHGIDLTDALQIVTLKRGVLRPLAGPSKPILITADKDLAAAAKAEGLRAWNCAHEPPP